MMLFNNPAVTLIRRWWSGPWFSAAAILTFVGSLMPTVIWYGRRMTDGSDEPLGVVALIAAAGFCVATCWHGNRSGESERQLKARASCLWAGSAGLLLLQVFGWLVYPLAIAILAVGIFAVSTRPWEGKAGVVALLMLSLPVLASLDFFAGYPLRLIAAEISRGLLAIGGIGVDRSGVMLMDGERLVGIDPPCAGIRMLWTSCFVAAFLAARMLLSWARTGLLLVAALGLVVLGNGVRAALVFLPESGRVDWPEWAHSGAGLLVHVGVLAAVFWIAGRIDGAKWKRRSGSSSPQFRRVVVAGVGVLFVSVGLLVRRSPGQIIPSASREPWPVMMEGVTLVRQPLGELEARFARSFPGEIAKFWWGDAEVILRRANRATRMMHPSGDCLRAAGFQVHGEPAFSDADGRLWGASVARRDGNTWTVHERYQSGNGNSCTDASAWYWQALLDPQDGPWLATTLIRREGRPLQVAPH